MHFIDLLRIGEDSILFPIIIIGGWFLKFICKDASDKLSKITNEIQSVKVHNPVVEASLRNINNRLRKIENIPTMEKDKCSEKAEVKK